MQYLEYPLWLAQQAFNVLCYFWPVTLALIIPFVITLAFRSPFVGPGSKFSRRHLSVFLPMTATLLILFWGAVMKHPGDSPNLGPSWPGYIVQALFFVQLAASIWAVWLMKGYRLFSIFTVVLELWFALACAFIAGMSVTRDWL
jgi:hypothetical protein